MDKLVFVAKPDIAITLAEHYYLMDGDNMYTKTEILQISKEQLELDYNCQRLILKRKNTIVKNKLIDGRRIYGIDVLPKYRGRGIGTNLVTILKNEVLKRGKRPFYGTVESHFHSQNIAVSSGFFPEWAELYSENK